MNGIDPPTPVSIGVVAPRLPKRGPGGVVDGSGRVDGVGLADVAGGDRHLRAPRRMLLEVAGQRREVFARRPRRARRAG